MKKFSRFFVTTLLLAIFCAVPAFADENEITSRPQQIETDFAHPIPNTNVVDFEAPDDVSPAPVSLYMQAEASQPAEASEADMKGTSAAEMGIAHPMEELAALQTPETVTVSPKAALQDELTDGGSAFHVQIEDAVNIDSDSEEPSPHTDVIHVSEITGPVAVVEETADMPVEVSDVFPAVETGVTVQIVSSAEAALVPPAPTKPAPVTSTKKNTKKENKTGAKKIIDVKGIGNKDGKVEFEVEEPKRPTPKKENKGVQLPEGVQRIVDKAGNWIDEFDDSTLDYVNKQLGHLGLEADSAELRPSGGGVGLEVSIKLHKDKKDEKKLSEEEQKLEKRKKVYSTLTPSKEKKKGEDL